MIKIIPASERHFSDMGWLQTYWLFSFGTYYDPENVQFGALRVFNDDIVAPGAGFPAHDHREMEIVTVILEGELTHEDSMGHKTVIRRGDVQRMSAGTGVTHSEFNRSDRPVHLYQIWIFPETEGLTPGYDQKHYDPMTWANKLYPLASGRHKPESVSLHADATIYRGDFEEAIAFDYETNESRCIFIYVAEGNLEVNGHGLGTADQARIDLTRQIAIKSLEDTEFMLIDVPSDRNRSPAKRP